MPKAAPFIEVEPLNFDALANKFGNSRELMLASLNSTLRKTGKLLVPQIKAETPRGATNKLANSTVFQVLGRAEDMRMEIRQSAFSTDGFPYGKAVRTGTKPHFPPIDPLIPWVMKKLGVAGSEAHQVAFLVARKISKVGTKAQPYHITVFNRNSSKLKEMLGDAVGQVMVKLADLPKGKS